MAIFTPLSPEDASAMLAHYGLGTLADLRGIPSGIENTNYFLDTSTGRFVLTVFERLAADELPFYLRLMQHLARRWLPVPEPAETRGGELMRTLHGKPAAIVTRMPGHAVLEPTPAHCAAVGAFMARMHLEGRDFPMQQPNLRGLGWWRTVLPLLEPHVPAQDYRLLTEQVIRQDTFSRSALADRLPTGAIHADLFRDNVLFDEDHAPGVVSAVPVAPPRAVAHDLQPLHPARIGGVIDFYFAATGMLLFDLAVAVNDWCVDLQTGAFDETRAVALLRAYHAVRPLTADEHEAWPEMLRGAALRFWVSRLHDLHLPRPAQVLTPHDPSRFGRMLRLRAATEDAPWT